MDECQARINIFGYPIDGCDSDGFGFHNLKTMAAICFKDPRNCCHHEPVEDADQFVQFVIQTRAADEHQIRPHVR